MRLRDIIGGETHEIKVTKFTVPTLTVRHLSAAEREQIEAEIPRPRPPRGDDGKLNFDDPAYDAKDKDVLRQRMYRIVAVLLADYLEGATMKERIEEVRGMNSAQVEEVFVLGLSPTVMTEDDVAKAEARLRPT